MLCRDRAEVFDCQNVVGGGELPGGLPAETLRDGQALRARKADPGAEMRLQIGLKGVARRVEKVRQALKHGKVRCFRTEA